MIDLETLKAQLGKTREEVIEAIGEPDDRSTGSRKYPQPDDICLHSERHESPYHL